MKVEVHFIWLIVKLKERHREFLVREFLVKSDTVVLYRLGNVYCDFMGLICRCTFQKV